jgi:cytochrome oxidase Cu insertion factor (SCO1/SenC/PrrC family)
MKKISIFLIVFGIWIALSPWQTIDGAEDPMSAAGVLPFTEKLNAPGFSLKDTNGNMVNLEDFKGKIVLLFFWATW